MALNDIPIGGQSVWTDMVFLTELRDEIGRPAMPDRDGMDLIADSGFKPRPPGDPRWLVLLAALACVLAALSIPLIIMLNQ